MINEQIVSYIRTETTQGVSRESVKQALLEKGWPPQEVEDAFYAVDNPAGSAPNPQVTIAEKERVAKNKWAFLSLGFSIATLLFYFVISLGLVGIPCLIFSIIFGFLGLGSQKRGFAIAGLVISGIVLLLFIIGIALVFTGAVPMDDPTAGTATN